MINNHDIGATKTTRGQNRSFGQFIIVAMLAMCLSRSYSQRLVGNSEVPDRKRERVSRVKVNSNKYNDSIVAPGLSSVYSDDRKRKLNLELYATRVRNYAPNAFTAVTVDSTSNNVSYPLYRQTNAIDYDNKYAFISFSPNFLQTRKTKPFAFYYTWDWRVFSDWIGFVNMVVADLGKKDGKKFKKAVNNAISNSLIGFHSFGLNVLGSEKFVLRSGVNIADYGYHVSGIDSDAQEGFVRENGHYTKAGPFVNVDYMPGGKLMLSTTFVMGAIPVFVYYRPYDPDPAGAFQAGAAEVKKWGNRTDGVKSPLFYFFNLEVMSSKGFFVRMELWKAGRTTDAEKASRQSVVIGVKLKTS